MACGYRAAGPAAAADRAIWQGSYCLSKPFQIVQTLWRPVRFGSCQQARPGPGALLLAPAAGHQSTTAHGLVADAP